MDDKDDAFMKKLRAALEAGGTVDDNLTEELMMDMVAERIHIKIALPLIAAVDALIDMPGNKRAIFVAGVIAAAAPYRASPPLDTTGFAKRLQAAMDEHGMLTPQLLAAELDVSKTTVNYWLAGRTVPGREHMQKLAKLFGWNDADG